VLPFTAQLAANSAEDFVELILRRCFRMRDLLIGYDHGFGRQRRAMSTFCARSENETASEWRSWIRVSTAEGLSVSSTSIRRAVAGGDLHRAAEALGRLYSVSGRVIEGEQRGRRIGFPT